MSDNVMCENCAHKDVCKHRDEFADIQKQLDNFKVFRNEGPIVPIKSLPYIEAPVLKCTKFIDRNVGYSKRSVTK